MEFYFLKKGWPAGKVHSELHVLQIRFQIRSLYHQKDLQMEDQGQFISNRKFWELSVLPWTAMKKMCWMSQQGTEKSIFREIFCFGCDVIMTIILQNTIFTFNLFEMESFDNCLCYVGNKQRSFWIFCKLSVLSFELASTLSLHWSCKIPFPDSTHFKLKVLIAECVTLKHHEKNALNVAARNNEEHFRVIFPIDFNFMTTMIL